MLGWIRRQQYPIFIVDKKNGIWLTMNPAIHLLLDIFSIVKAIVVHVVAGVIFELMVPLWLDITEIWIDGNPGNQQRGVAS